MSLRRSARCRGREAAAQRHDATVAERTRGSDMITARQLATVLGVAALVAGTVKGADLLRNGSFREQDGAGRPTGWRVADDGQRVDLDKQEGALRVDIAKAGENDGQIGQRLDGLSAGRAYVLSGRLRSTKTGIGYLQVKLHRGGREQQRLPSAPIAAAFVRS